MPKLITPDLHVPDRDTELLQRLLQKASYDDARVTGFYDEHTQEIVELFQAQHVDQDGRALAVDAFVGDSTWWALRNPSGPAQRSGHAALSVDIGAIEEPGNGDRQFLLDHIHAEYAKDVVEDPDGCNRSAEIDTYWGTTGIIGKAWCCAYVSTMLARAKVHSLEKHHLGVQKMWRMAQDCGLTTTTPKPGDIFVQLFSRGRGHTGFGTGFTGHELDSEISTIEGNCGNRLKSGRRQMHDISGWIDVIQDGKRPIFQLEIEQLDVSNQGTR